MKHVNTTDRRIGAGQMTWTAERVSELRKLWATGASTAEIGRRSACPRTPWSARRTARAWRPAPRRSAACRLPPPPARPVRLAPIGKAVCNWPFGDPQDDDFHFCGAEAEPRQALLPRALQPGVYALRARRRGRRGRLTGRPPGRGSKWGLSKAGCGRGGRSSAPTPTRCRRWRRTCAGPWRGCRKAAASAPASAILARGKLLPRERVRGLFDPGSPFLETLATRRLGRL